MNTDRINKWLALGANFGVLVGILLLAYELRQNHDMTAAQIRNELSQGLTPILSMPVENPGLARALLRDRAGEALSPEQAAQVWSYNNALFRYWENVHYQYRKGLYDEEEFSAHRAAMRGSVLTGRAKHAHWCDWRETYSPGFRAEVDAFFADRPCADGQPAP